MNESSAIAVIAVCWLAVQAIKLTFAARAKKRADAAKAAREYREAQRRWNEDPAEATRL